MSQKGFLKKISSVSTRNEGAGYNYDYWKHRTQDPPVNGKEILKRRKIAQDKAERYKLIKLINEC
jgi:hypothetical protein